MIELWGIDDPQERDRLREKALCTDAFAKRVVTKFAIVGGVASIAALGSAWLPSALGFDFIVRSILAGGLGAWAVLKWDKRRMRKHVGRILRSEGRCEQCGYKLDGGQVNQCPECGEAF